MAKSPSPDMLSSIDRSSTSQGQFGYFHSKKNSPTMIYNDLDLHNKKSTNPKK